MLLGNRQQVDRTSLPVNSQPLTGADDRVVKDRRIHAADRRFKTITKPLLQPCSRCFVGIGRDPLALDQRVLAQIVDAVDVVGMGMRVNDTIEPGHFCRKHLLAKIRTGVDDDAGGSFLAKPLDERGAAQTAIFRIGRVTLAPFAIDARNAG